jgi:hypothetical protein
MIDVKKSTFRIMNVCKVDFASPSFCSTNVSSNLCQDGGRKVKYRVVFLVKSYMRPMKIYLVSSSDKIFSRYCLVASVSEEYALFDVWPSVLEN